MTFDRIQDTRTLWNGRIARKKNCTSILHMVYISWFTHVWVSYALITSIHFAIKGTFSSQCAFQCIVIMFALISLFPSCFYSFLSMLFPSFQFRFPTSSNSISNGPKCKSARISEQTHSFRHGFICCYFFIFYFSVLLLLFKCASNARD